MTEDCEIEKEIAEIENNSKKYFDQLIRINLSELRALHRRTSYSRSCTTNIQNGRRCEKETITLIQFQLRSLDRCTNSSYEDMSRAASIAEQAKSKGVKIKVPLLVTPGSEMVRATIERDGQMESMKAYWCNCSC